MIVKNKPTFFTGAFLALTFAGVLALIFSPVFGDGKNGLVYADDMFNKLSKGSSYFIPKVLKSNEKFANTTIDVGIKFEKPEQIDGTIKLLATAGIEAKNANPELQINGNLGALMAKIIQDSDDMYKNNGAAVAARYGVEEKKVMESWHGMLKGADKVLKKQGKIEESKIVSDVMKKAVEPAYNYYKIDAQKVTEKAGIMTGLLVFYVAYTMWWGFAIFYIFDGIGLTMKKAKVKKEV
jgi:5-enolpyruvylshikimate-3-phosphate synthase